MDKRCCFYNDMSMSMSTPTSTSMSTSIESILIYLFENECVNKKKHLDDILLNFVLKYDMVKYLNNNLSPKFEHIDQLFIYNSPKCFEYCCLNNIIDIKYLMFKMYPSDFSPMEKIFYSHNIEYLKILCNYNMFSRIKI